uniref:Uncharacterized protein n=1 Tax=Ananas comosus var. bracteatus TaxID=296719 RepID=A0A6V7NPY9_ANACO|nr:unnamed protein product [Ananas comosus var. bracteatus]
MLSANLFCPLPSPAFPCCRHPPSLESLLLDDDSPSRPSRRCGHTSASPTASCRPTKKVGCGPMAAAAVERGATERRRWDAAAATARMAAMARVAAAALCRMQAPCGGGSEARRGGAEKVGCGSGSGKGGGSGAGGRIGGDL